VPTNLRHHGSRPSISSEASYGWEWLAELLEEAGYDLHLAHPLRTRAIAAARVKTDAIDAPRRRLDSLIALICDFDREIEQTTAEIEQRAKADDRVDVLTQIRGVGRYTAMLIIAEIGEVKRFPTAKHLCQWAGLTPTVRSSDGKARLGHISRQGSTILRWALTEAAQHTPTGGGPLRTKYERIAKRRGSKIAKVAIAREILTLCYYGLRDGEIRCLTHQPAADDLAEAA
jgi:transposase